MASPSSSYGTLFLGGGNAAGYFAAEYDRIVSGDPTLKDSAFGGSLAVVTDESVVSYERPALSKAYLSPSNPPRLPGFHSCVGGGGERQEPSWYESRGIAYLTGARVERVDASGKTVKLADGREISYQKLVISTGARPVDLSRDLDMPGALSAGEERAASTNVFYLRSRDDADALYSALAAEAERAKGETRPRPLVVGGGYIGLELAAALVGWGLPEPLVAFPEERALARVMTGPASEFYRKFYELRGGVVFRSGVSVSALERGEDGKVTSAKLSDGTVVPVSLVVVGVGARPETGLFRAASGVAVVDGAPGGVEVDSRLRSVSAADTWACGDVAAFPSSCLFGSPSEDDRPTRQEHVQHARSSAAFVARDVVAASSSSSSAPSPTYTYLPYYYSRVFDLSWVFYGRASTGEEAVVEFGEASREDVLAAARGEKKAFFGAFHLSGERKIVGVFLEGGSPEDNAAAKKLVEGGASVEEGTAWAEGKAAKL